MASTARRLVVGTGIAVLLAHGVLADVATAAQDDQQADEDRRAQLVVSEEMIEGSTFSLEPDGSVFDLDPGVAVSGVETVLVEDTTTTVTLTADLLFEFAKSDLSPAATDAIASLVGKIPQGAAVTVDGHTDARGDDSVNGPLSQRRADAVAAVLVLHRPDLTLTVTGHGSTQPVADDEIDGEDNPVGRALNRRVEVSYPSE